MCHATASYVMKQWHRLRPSYPVWLGCSLRIQNVIPAEVDSVGFLHRPASGYRLTKRADFGDSKCLNMPCKSMIMQEYDYDFCCLQNFGFCKSRVKY